MARRTTVDSSTIKVTICKVGEIDQTLTLAKDVTVLEALEAAGYDSNFGVKLNGDDLNHSDILEDGDEIFVNSNVKDGLM